MCGCGGFVMQRGVPLNEETLSRMRKKERSFWLDFLEEAEQVIGKARANDNTKPFTPPPSLRAKYRKALKKYDGERYCQIKQLQEIFSF